MKLTAWMGVPARKVAISGESTQLHAIVEGTASAHCVALSAETLTVLAKNSDPAEVRQFLEDRCRHLLVYSTATSAGGEQLLRWLTGGEVCRQLPSTVRSEFQFPKESRKYSRQFAGLSFSTQRETMLPAFELSRSPASDTRTILSADGAPVFVRSLCGSCEVFLIALSDAPDIDLRLSQELRIDQFYDQLLGVLLFLKHCFPESFWQAPQSTARFIIDDPLIGGKYGFLDYEKLVASMRSAKFGTSIAFIPWNQWRTSKETGEGLSAEKSRFSVCIHGCDHTNQEFSSDDEAGLRWRAATALRRMEIHEKRTGLAFDRVMIFPQGWFSTLAISALRRTDYLAAVNTTCFPVNHEREPLTIADFLRPAITRFDGFPIFPRRYPRRLIDCAFDLFIGRPALLVQHHNYFSDGYARIEEFVRGLYQVEPSLEWPTLSSQLMNACILRSTSENTMDVQFFTRRFRLKNTRANQTTFRLAKREPDPAHVASVIADGVTVPFSSENGFVTLEVTVEPERSVCIEVVDRADRTATATGPGFAYRVGVPVRRALSEFRDNTLVRHPRLLEMANGLAKAMKVTADHDREELL